MRERINQITKIPSPTLEQAKEDIQFLLSIINQGETIYDAGNGRWSLDTENIIPDYKPKEKGILILREPC